MLLLMLVGGAGWVAEVMAFQRLRLADVFAATSCLSTTSSGMRLVTMQISMMGAIVVAQELTVCFVSRIVASRL